MGIFIINKPLGLTSFDVVARARKFLGTRRIGHTGTLDPLATGVLVLCTDSSTKLVQFLETDSKDYLAFVSLGASTATLDAEGPILETTVVPEFGVEKIENTLAQFRGSQLQMPPAYSAIHVNGQRAYDLARAGKEVKLAARPVTISKLELQVSIANMQEAKKFSDAALPASLGEFPTLVLSCTVSAGTYIRSLARDIGAALGVPAHLAGLVRTRVGKFHLTDACEPEALTNSKPLDDLVALDLEQIELNANQAKDVRDGKRMAHTQAGRFVLTHAGALVAIADCDGETLKVVRVWQ